MHTTLQSLLLSGTGMRSPRQLQNLAAWYDPYDLGSIVVDASNRVQLVSDKSGNSAVNVLCLNGVAGNYASVPDSPAVSVPGPIDLRIAVALNDYTPSAVNVLMAKDVVAGNQRSWQWNIQANGIVRFAWSKDGSTTTTADSSVAPTLSDYAFIWLRVTLDTVTGDVKFYTSSDGTTWTQLGAAVATGVTGGVFDSTAAIAIGNRTDDLFGPASGRFYRAQIYNGIAGALVLDADFSTAAKLATSFVCATGQTVTINTTGRHGARISGARDLVNMTAAEQPVYLPWSGANYGYLNATSGNYFSTPAQALDCAVLTLSGTVQAVDYTPSGAQTLLSQRNTTGNQRAMLAVLLANGRFELNLSADGITDVSVDSGVSTGFTDRSALYWRIEWRKSDGRTQFFTSPDGVTYTQLGTDKTLAVASIFASTATIQCGSNVAGTAALFAGNVIRGTIAKDGVTLVDFDPARYVSGTTFTGTTGETWTLNGGAHIVTRTCLYGDGSDDNMKAAPFAQGQPTTVHILESQVSYSAFDGLFDGNAEETLRLQQWDISGRLSLGCQSGKNITRSGTPLQTHQALCVIGNGTAGSIRENRASLTTGDAGVGSPNGFTLFARGGITGFSNITVSEVIIVAAAHSQQMQDRVALYLQRKHRLPR
jgi:hypothetical protein